MFIIVKVLILPKISPIGIPRRMAWNDESNAERLIMLVLFRMVWNAARIVIGLEISGRAVGIG